MTEQTVHAITGAFGYSGRFIAQRLLDQGGRVITLTNSVKRRNDFHGRIRAYPFNFDQPGELAATLDGVHTLYNTYWIRFEFGDMTFDKAVENSRILFEAAKQAGVKRVVHVSITNPDEASPLPYFRGKGIVERLLKESGLSHAILRPAILFGHEDILLNNIAWSLRHLPVIGVFGDGQYSLQPIHVEDFARLAVEQGALQENTIINAIGPETFTYRGLVQTISKIIRKRRPMVQVPINVGYWAARMLGKIVGDIMLTREELAGLMSNLLYVPGAPPTGEIVLTDWVREHADRLGVHYASELARRKDRTNKYSDL